jgi:hypothetical protein
MKTFRSMLVASLCIAFAASGLGQSHAGGHKSQTKTQTKTQVKKQVRSTQKAAKVQPKRQVKVMPRPVTSDAKWWKSEDDRISRDLRLSPRQGNVISDINRKSAILIHEAQKSGLRGQALSRRIAQIRTSAKVQIQRALTADQRRRWDWRAWESRWDAQWIRVR